MICTLLLGSRRIVADDVASIIPPEAVVLTGLCSA